jgi:NTE family protein
MPNRALVLSGGGSKGAFEVGAVDYLVNDRGLDFEVVLGVSTGSLNAVILAQGADLSGLKTQVAALKDLWFGIRSSDDIYKKRFLGNILVLLTRNSIYSPDPLRKKLETNVFPERLKASGKDLRVGAVVLESGDYVTIDQADASIIAWTLASSSMPVFFPPVRVAGHTAVDGGVRNITPLKDAFDALKKRADAKGAMAPERAGADAVRSAVSPEPDEIYVVLASPLDIRHESGPWKTGIDVAKRSVAILSNEILRTDLHRAFTVNQAVQFYESVEEELNRTMGRERARKYLESVPFPFRPPDYRYVRLWTILPEIEYSQTLEFHPQKIREAYEGGRQAAQRALGEAEFATILRDSDEPTAA